MSEATIRTAIYNAVNGVANKGVCYDYERHATDWSDFLDLFKTTVGGTDQIRGWMVGYRGAPEVEATRFGVEKRIMRKHRFQILGIMGIDDSAASEKTFAALAELVCNTLDADATLQGFDAVSPAILGFDPSPFAGILVHAAAITINITESV